MSCFTAILAMTSCTTDNIDEQTKIEITNNEIEPPPTGGSSSTENGGNTKDKDKDNN